MSSGSLPEVTHIRHQLRACLAARRFDPVPDLLAELGRMAIGDRSLRCELERWSIQFELLAASGLAA